MAVCPHCQGSGICDWQDSSFFSFFKPVGKDILCNICPESAIKRAIEKFDFTDVCITDLSPIWTKRAFSLLIADENGQYRQEEEFIQALEKRFGFSRYKGEETFLHPKRRVTCAFCGGLGFLAEK